MRRSPYRPAVVLGWLPERPVVWPFAAAAIFVVWTVALASDWLLSQGCARRKDP